VLLSLQVRDLAILDAVDVALGPGLNVVTGETGAGKSILVDALALALGRRASSDVVRTHATAAEVTALFDVSKLPTVRQRLADAGIPDEDELAVRRVISSEAGGGRSRAYVNGRLVSLGQLAHITAGLVDVTSQHEQQTLGDPAEHLAFLDASASLEQRREQMATTFAAYAAATTELDACLRNLRDRAVREDLLRHQIREIDDVPLATLDETLLATERERLRHATRLREGSARAEQTLYSGEPAAIDLIADAAGVVQELARLDASLRPISEQIDAARAQVEDAARELGRYTRSIQADPERMTAIAEQTEALARLKRKYGPTVADVVAFRDRARADLDNLVQGEERVHALENAVELARGAAADVARALSAERRNAAEKLGSAISKELQSLGMGGAKIVVDVTPRSAATGDLAVDGARLSALGIDRAEFLIAPNRGEEPRPLRRIASGGELSRALLAVKRVLADVGESTAYVFDEVDAGVGGAVAEVIGKKLRAIAKRSQVLVITHLPQIAVHGDRHLVVGKRVASGRTIADVREVGGAERVEEIARMLGGLKVSAKTRAAAKEMLADAR